MGLFDFLFGRKKEPIQPGQPAPATQQPLLEPVTVLPGITLPKALADQWPIIEKTKRTYIKINATPDNELTLRQSKFGHYPCLPKGFDYPTDPDGNYMYPLAQINFSECPPLAGFPTSGYLQFYFAADDMYGLDYDHPQAQTGFRILFFEEDQVQDPITELAFLDETLTTEYSPVESPHRLSFSLQEEYAGMNDYQLRGNPVSDMTALTEGYPAVKEELMEALYHTFPSNGHKLGGYAYFTQEDPRMYHSEWQDYQLVLQVDSDDHIMWGDVGVVIFFIQPEDLANKDFSKLVYNWDCC